MEKIQTIQDIRYEDYKSLKQWVRSRTSNIYNNFTILELREKRFKQIDTKSKKIIIKIPKGYKEVYLGRISGTFFPTSDIKTLRIEIDTGDGLPTLMGFDEIKRSADLIQRLDTEQIILKFPKPTEGDLDLEVKILLVKDNGSK